MSTDPARYALYFTPTLDSALWRKGCRWLGRDAETGEALAHPVPEGLAGADIVAATAAPRKYGFHATLKPPFRLAAGYAPEYLHNAIAAFCRKRRPFEASPPTVEGLGDFIALRPRYPSAELTQLADDCVRTFDDFRAPLSHAELEKRHARRLTERQVTLLEEWGYPYVFEEFRFHLTLTGSLRDSVHPTYEKVLQDYFAPDCKAALYVDGVTLFKQPAPDAPFVIEHRYRFNGAALEDETAA